MKRLTSNLATLACAAENPNGDASQPSAHGRGNVTQLLHHAGRYNNVPIKFRE
jgi:hypothetical protein